MTIITLPVFITFVAIAFVIGGLLGMTIICSLVIDNKEIEEVTRCDDESKNK